MGKKEERRNRKRKDAEEDMESKRASKSDSRRQKDADAKARASAGMAPADDNDGRVSSKQRADDDAQQKSNSKLLDSTDVTQYGGDVFEAEAAYYPNAEADAEAMEVIAAQGDVDEAGGIQAFVAEDIIICADDVGIIRSDEDVEMEEKTKYTKRFAAAVCCVVLAIIAIGVPVTWKVYSNNRKVVIIVTEEPTSAPSLMPSTQPSAAPTTERFTAVVDLLIPLSGEWALTSPESPHHQAARWIADYDGMGMELNHPGFKQRYVMALFFFAMDGPRWENNRGWLGPESECSWFGIEGASPECSEGCTLRLNEDDYARVCRIKLGFANNLFGQIPSEMGMLTEMRYLEIQKNFMYGTIPQELGDWAKINAFLVNFNFLSGSIPYTFQDHEFLGTLFVNDNRLNGTLEVIPTLKNLAWLEAEDNEFSGTLPSDISHLKKMRIFNVNNNSLTGFLPDEWSEDNLLEDFEIEDNNFRGPLPQSLGKIKFLKDVRMSHNSLTGAIPTSYYGMEYLEELHLNHNNLGGELPQTAEPFYTELQEISIHNNEFEGRFPVEHFENTLRIKIISLHNNQLSGSITKNICDRLSPEFKWSRLMTLSADCGELSCGCCKECWSNGERVEG